MISMAFLFPAGLYATYNGLPLFRILHDPFKWTGLLHATIVALNCGLDWFGIQMMILTILIDTNSTYKWIRIFNDSW